MLWIKRNLFLLVGILVALALLVGACILLWSGLGKNREISATLDAVKAEIAALNATEPYPSAENIQAVKKDKTGQQQLLTNIQQVLTPASIPAVPTDQQLKQLLETTIFELQREAETANVVLPPRYNFSFDAQRLTAKFHEGSHLALATQIGEVKTIASILFKSGVQSLSFIKRVPAALAETTGTTDYLDKGIVTNKFTIPTPHYVTLTPYQVRFMGFSAELEKVLDALRRAPVFFVVKKIDFKGDSAEVALPVGVEFPPGKPAADKMAATPAPAPTVARTVRGATVGANTTALTILDEKPIEVTLLIEVIKLHKPAK